MSHGLFRQLPKMDVLLADPRLAALPRAVVREAARQLLDEIRVGIGSGEVTELPDLASIVLERIRPLIEGRLKPVINATGIVVHTNLGRAPWSAAARDEALALSGYCNLEMDLETGARGGRLDGVRKLSAHLTGAEDAIVVNNCAAAVLLALTALARDREVVVSRGELVEIGGSFRIPDVIASGGAKLVEVGTTNRTRIADYREAVGEDTAVLLKIHRSNFRIVGFSEDTPREALVALGRERGLPVVEDLGSGSLDGGHGEPSVRDVVAAGVDVVLFSGDKLLGGTQAGLAVGRRDAIRRMRKHPLYRALRVDKVILGAVERTLVARAAGRLSPVEAMLAADEPLLEARAKVLAAALVARGIDCAVEPSLGFVGGGALPGQGLPSRAVVVSARGVEAVALALRCGAPAIVARIADGSLWLDVRTLTEDQLPIVADRVASAVAQSGLSCGTDGACPDE